MRVRGDNIFPGYRNNDEATKRRPSTKKATTASATPATWLDEAAPSCGVVFDGRVAEDFKLTSGTWVSVGTLRVRWCRPWRRLAQDVVITGHDRSEIGVLVFLTEAGRQLPHDEWPATSKAGLRALKAEGGGSLADAHPRPGAARRSAAPTDKGYDAGEITDKGYMSTPFNQRHCTCAAGRPGAPLNRRQAQLRQRRAAGATAHSSMPVIAVLHGAVVGGGLELASSAHLRVAEDSTFYGLPEGTRGIFVGGGGSVRISRLIGVARMTDMMLTGRVFDADEGQTFGISNYRVADGAGLAKALDLATKIASNAPLSNYAITQALPRIADLSASDGLFMETLISSIAQGDEAAKERVRAFLEKRANKVAKA
jgi:enoyl-CoA hydratase/carnithine racemase